MFSTRPALAALVLTACVKLPPSQALQAPAALVPAQDVYLRSSLDADPSAYLGRFLPDGLADLDESAAMPLACSKHITWRFVDGGGVTYTELLSASSEVSARLGVPVVLSASGAASSAGVVRVEYELTGKMIAEVADPEAFNACCAEQPDQCTRRFIGEFLQGRGSAWHETSAAQSAQVAAMTPQASGEVAASHGRNWQRSVTFPNPVYFAFKVAGTGHDQSTGTSCEDWMSSLPSRPGKTYVVGVGRDARTETAARNQALMNANNQAYLAGLVAIPDVEAAEPTTFDGVKAEDWCVERVASAKGERYRAKVLAWADSGGARVAGPSL